MSLRGTQTEKNILTAFSGESQARNRYQHEGTTAPDTCPACAHSQAHFEITPSNY
jgi:rubrerythrin